MKSGCFFVEDPSIVQFHPFNPKNPDEIHRDFSGFFNPYEERQLHQQWHIKEAFKLSLIEIKELRK